MDPQHRELRDLADSLVRALQRVGVMLTYDRDGVAGIEAYVEDNRAHWTEADHERLCPQIGSFVGECMVAVYGAQWTARVTGEEPGVALGTGDTAFPITKAYKFLRGDRSDSLLSFFDTTGTIIARGGISRV